LVVALFTGSEHPVAALAEATQPIEADQLRVAAQADSTLAAFAADRAVAVAVAITITVAVAIAVTIAIAIAITITITITVTIAVAGPGLVARRDAEPVDADLVVRTKLTAHALERLFTRRAHVVGARRERDQA
jgi:hypothetical protein